MADEHRHALEAHSVIPEELGSEAMESLKREIKRVLWDDFKIGHSTLEFEFSGTECESNNLCNIVRK